MINILTKSLQVFRICLLVACLTLLIAPNAYTLDEKESDDDFHVVSGLATEEYEAAVERALKALETDPNDLDARRSLARAYYHLEDYERALAEQKNVIDIAPEPAASDFLNLGYIYDVLGDEKSALATFHDAVRVCRDTLEHDPDNLDARRVLVFAYFHLGDFMSALEEQTNVMEMAPEPNEEDYLFLGAIYSNLGSKAEALEALKQGANLLGTERLWSRVGAASSDLKDHEGEVYAYNKVLELNPNDYCARRNLVDAYMNLGKPEFALEQQKIAIERAEEPESDDYYDLWLIYEKLGDKEQMLQTFQQAEQLFGLEEAWSIRAWSYMKINDYESAADAARRMLEINPKSVDGQRALAYAYYELEDYDRALKEHKLLFEMAKEPIERDYRNLGIIYEQFHDGENMVRTFEEAADVFGTQTSWEFVVLSRDETGDYEGAIEACHTLLEMNPDSVFARRGLASAYIGLKEYERALEEQGTALEMAEEPEEEDYWNLGVIHSRLKDYNASVGAYRKALELNPGNKDVRRYLARNLYRIGEYEAAADELSQLHSGNRDRILLGWSMLKHLLLPLLILSMLFLFSKSRRLSPFFCEPLHEEEDFLKTLMVILFVLVLELLVPPLFHNPFAPHYWKKIFISLCLYDSMLKEEWGRYISAYALSALIIPAYYMRKSNIPILPLFTIDPKLLKTMAKSLLKGFLLLMALGIPIFVILTLVFPAEFQSSQQLSEQRRQTIQAFSLFGKMGVGVIFPFMEEFCFRGMVFLCLRRRFKASWSIVFSALLFMASHYFYDPISKVAAFNAGIVLAYLMHKTRSLWPPFIFHAMINSANVVFL